MRAAWLSILVTLSPCHLVTLSSHPVPKKAHDRTIVVRLTPEAVVIVYQLDVDEWTAVNDLLPLIDSERMAQLTQPNAVYEAFTRAYGPILASNLSAALDRQELEFRCVSNKHQRDTDHLRCDFIFRAEWKPPSGQPARFTFQEGNYVLDPGRIDLSLVAAEGVTLLKTEQPSVELKKRPVTELRPGDEGRLRRASASFEVKREATSPPATVVTTSSPEASHARSLLDLLFNTELGLWTLLTMSAGLGAIHALTPGHGKTLVAAYLVGERGTVWHAVLLGLVTTLTHTGSVLLLALLLVLLFPETVPAQVQMVLGFVGGLLVAGLGFWLLMRRLAGQADHVHIGGHSHHHHHDHHHHGMADHFHDEQGHTHLLPADGGWWGLIVLGFSGGIVPCNDAVLLLGVAIKAHRLPLALPLLLAFSAGLAGVLVVIGVLVVKAKGFAGTRWGESRLFRILPVVSAILVLVLGLWLCYDSLHSVDASSAGLTASPGASAD
jgi:ABC-type nickel/cobalt efflux system permease component RcnA